MSEFLDGLNDSQKQAVTTTEGPVMVMAGAGSGKTKVLTSRIAYLIKELGISPMSILAVTFTNKAAGEMKDRVSNMLAIETKSMWVSTFHSFSARLLRIEISKLPPYSKNFVIIDDDDALKIIKGIMSEKELNDYKPKEIKNLISKSKNFLDFNIKDKHEKYYFNTIKPLYQEYLKQENLMDFDDLIINVIELFKNNPTILTKYQEKFQYILVDEFQDTNYLQYQLMFMLASRYHNIFVVGDDFQSIYSFRGAKIENINKFRKDFLETKLILLEKNYRSTTEILNLANSIIEHNPNQIKKVMTSNDKNGGKPIYYRATSSYDEGSYVVNMIEKLKKEYNYEYRDFAILYRANYVSRNFEDILIKHDLPYKIYGSISFFSRKEIKDMLAYLRLIINNDDNFSFKRIVNEPKRKIGESLITKLQNVAEEYHLSLFNSISLYNGSGVGVKNLNEFESFITSERKLVNSIQIQDIIDDILLKTGYQEELKKDMDTYQDRVDNIKELKSVLKEAKDDNAEKSNIIVLDELLQNLALRSDNERDKDSDSILLSTYHQVKGLEFKVVFMVALEESIFPSNNIVSQSEIEEERRICYVGITRAKDHLFLTNCTSRYFFGKSSFMEPSRFINELDSNCYIDYYANLRKKTSIQKTTKVVKKEETKEVRKTSFKIGDKINHKVFGDGVIVKVDGDKISVAFKSPIGIKQLMASHPSIKKIE